MNDRDPVHVPLRITQAKASDLSNEFQSLIADAGSSDDGLEVHKIVGILRELWERIVAPIVKALGVLEVPRGARIW